MAKIKFGQIISEARGKIAGMVFSRNGSCSYVRQKVTPINPQTSYQYTARLALGAAAKAWAGLSDAIKAQWQAHVSEFAKKNSIGDTYTPSGFNGFVSRYRNLLLIGQAAPTTYPGNTPGGSFTTLTGSISHGPELFEITLDSACAAADTGVVYATAPMSEGRSFAKSEYRFIRTFEAADTATFGLTGTYTAKFGAIPQAGEKCFVKVMTINTTTGKAGAELAKSVK